MCSQSFSRLRKFQELFELSSFGRSKKGFFLRSKCTSLVLQLMLYKEHQFFQNLADYKRSVTTQETLFDHQDSLIIDVGSNTVKFGLGGDDWVVICLLCIV
jgi:hypothetical protein